MATYRPPSVIAEEIRRTVAVSPRPSNFIIAIIGKVTPSAPFQEEVVLHELDEFTLAKKGINADSVTVSSRDRATEYDVTDHFTVNQTNADAYKADTKLERVSRSVTNENVQFNSGQGQIVLTNPKGVHDYVVKSSNGSTTYQEFKDYTVDPYSGTIYRLSSGTIPLASTIHVSYSYGIESDEPLLVTYTFADADYYSPGLFDSYAEISAKFGLPFNSEGTPNQLVLAAQMAFSNGSSQTQVLAIPVNPRFTDADNNSKTEPSLADWQLAVEELDKSDVEANIVVETSGNIDFQRSYLGPYVRDHRYFVRPRIAIFGIDGVAATTTDATLRNYATATNHERIVIVNDTKYEVLNTSTGAAYVAGGQYAAAAVAGCLTRNKVQDSITRQQVNGVRPLRLKKPTEMNTDTVSGLCALESKSGFIGVRHATTTAYNDINTRELNVIRQKDYLIKTMRDTLDATIIGRLMEPDVDLIVGQIALRILELMRNDYAIADYTMPQVVQDPTNPTRLDVAFDILPNYAVNEIRIQFALTPLGSIGTSG